MGQGEPILIIHGGPGLNHKYLFRNLQFLTDKYQLIFYDQRASGRSSLTLDSNSVTIDNFIQDIDELKNTFGIEKLIIIAHSWGGLLAMKYAIKHPEDTKLLILINSVAASSEISTMANQILAERFTKEDSIHRAEIIQSDEFQKRAPNAIGCKQIKQLPTKNSQQKKAPQRGVFYLRSNIYLYRSFYLSI